MAKPLKFRGNLPYCHCTSVSGNWLDGHKSNQDDEYIVFYFLYLFLRGKNHNRSLPRKTLSFGTRPGDTE